MKAQTPSTAQTANTSNSVEIWVKLEGFDKDYEVSNHGRHKRFYKDGTAKIFTPSVSGSGYRGLRLRINGVLKYFYTHQLVAMAFLDHTIDGKVLVVDHIDNNKLNNHISNLQIVTTRENLSKDRSNKYGYTGIGYNKEYKKYFARLYKKGKYTCYGHYNTPKEAHERYIQEVTKNKNRQ